MAAARDVVCPFCFAKRSTSVAAFRCLGRPDDPECPRIADEPLGRLQNCAAPVLKKVVERSARFGRAFSPPKGGVTCDCGGRTRPVCVSCHSPLPHGYAENGDRMIGLVGSKASGKSHYIAVLLHELYHNVGPQIGAYVETLDDDTRSRLTNDITPRIYDQGLTLPGSSSASSADDRVRRPMAMRMNFERAKVNTVFFDTAGEDLVNAAVLEREGRYIGQCGALILLIDPLQIQGVRDAVGSTVELPNVVIDPTAIVRNVAQVVRRERGLPPGEPLSQPLAVVLSKLDVIRPLLDPDSAVLAEPHSNGGYDNVASRSIGALLRAQLAEWVGTEFDAVVQSTFPINNCFAVSALGAQPEPSGRLTRDVAPHRVADPLLWILSEWETVPVMAGTR